MSREAGGRHTLLGGDGEPTLWRLTGKRHAGRLGASCGGAMAGASG
jgi:hypothetical protein